MKITKRKLSITLVLLSVIMLLNSFSTANASNSTPPVVYGPGNDLGVLLAQTISDPPEPDARAYMGRRPRGVFGENCRPQPAAGRRGTDSAGHLSSTRCSYTGLDANRLR